MPKITLKPMDLVVDIPEGESLLDAVQSYVHAECGGAGTCGKCLVKILSGTVSFDNNGKLDQKLVSQGYVLACLTTVLSDPLVVEISKQIEHVGGKFSELEDESNNLQVPKFDFHQTSPLVSLLNLHVSKPQLEDGLSDVDRISKAISEKIGIQIIHYPLNILRKIAKILREADGDIILLYKKAVGGITIVEIVSESNISQYGLAIDIGTTSIAVQLVDTTNGRIIVTYSDYNDQIKCGQDVISRINYTKRKGGLYELQKRVLDTINRLVLNICEKNTVNPNRIFSAVISGNTTMIHLFLGLFPEYIRLDPYTPTVLDVPEYSAIDIGLNIHPNAILLISPAVGSYVGGDITSGLLCTDLDKREDISLFIDIGTNGELVIGNNDFLMTCACSAGPAFEGAGLEYGMRAVRGAIDKVKIEKDTGKIVSNVIGACDPEGICGSGVISLLAQLFLTGWVDAAGKLNREKKSPFIEITGRIAKYIIVPEEKSENGKQITISEVEITNILRAKAAIYSAISLILKNIDLSVEEMGTVFIGGNFGRYLNLEDAITIGLLPDLPLEKFKYLGNSSLMGSYLLLISEENRIRQQELVKKMTYLELNTDLSYMDQYTGALFLPHTNIDLFPTVKKKFGNK